jgi:signal transduction histidine kinase/DNA-binding response OmpR family regulator/ligand-binding sensor domain-containing protein
MVKTKRLVLFVFLWALLLLNFSVTVKAQYPQQNEIMDVSNLNIDDIAQDSIGYIWLATERGLDRLDCYQNHSYFDHNSSLSSSSIRRIYVDKRGTVYAFTMNDIHIYDRKNNDFIRIKNNSSDNWTTGVTEDNNDGIWYSTGNGLYKIDAKSRSTHRVLLPILTHPILDICASDNGIIWAAMKDGTVNIYNPQLNRIVGRMNMMNFQQIVKGPWENTICGVQSSRIIVFNTLTMKAIRTIVPPNSPIIIKAGATADRRLYYLTSDFHLYIYNRNNSIVSNYVKIGDNAYISDLLIDKSSNIWIGTMANGYVFISSKQSKFDADNNLSSYFHNKFVTYLTSNKTNKIWVATYYEGLKEYDKNTKTIKSILSFKEERQTTIPDISSCFCDSKKRLWASTKDAVYCFKTIPATTLMKKYTSLKDVRHIIEDRQGNIWFISDGKGVFELPSTSSDKLITPYPTLPKVANIAFLCQLRSGEYVFSSYGINLYIGYPSGRCVPFNKCRNFGKEIATVIYIFEDSRGLIWMGTYHYGLLCYNPRTCRMQNFTIKNGLPSNDVLSITEDKKGHIWMSTSYGLSEYTGNGTFFNYFTSGSLLGNQYHERSVFNEGDLIYFTGNHGITSFNPEAVSSNHRAIPFMIDYLSTDMNTYYMAGPTESEKLKLSYKENSFNVSFLGFDYASANNLKYSYILEGFDKSWSAPSNNRSVRYSNISPGTYYLKAKVCDADGHWNNKVLTLKIVIPPAPWVSWWAYLLYIIIIIFLVMWALRVYNDYKMNQERVKLSELTLSKERELNQAKINFFENVSHELRTPLGLIYAPFCELLKIGGFTQKGNEYMSLMGSNIERLMTLVEQILNFAQLKSETLSLSVKKLDIVGLVWKVLKRFRGENEEKHIETSFSSTEEHLMMYVDEDKVDKILSNLLSNAFKYTPSNGSILLTMKKVTAQEVMNIFGYHNLIDTTYVLISIKDTGIGIEKDEIDKIFDRFYRSTKKKVSTEVGSGIGLYYIRCLVTQQKGFIKAEQNPDKGSNFMFCLPVSDSSFNASEIVGSPEDVEIKTEDTEYTTPQVIEEKEEEEGPEEEQRTDEEKPLLLIVEDEPNLQKFLGLLLGHYYNIQKAFDGREGLQIAQKIIPDIILLDVMMPVLNGYEVCESIKNNINTCHIPVVMLSAKTNVVEQIEGVNSGADVYIPKPFNPDYLISVLQGVLSNRKRMQHLIVESSQADDKVKQEEIALNQLDQELLSTLNERIESNIDNLELSVDELAKGLNFSRSTFYRKIKSLTGFSPNDYIRVFRVRKAAQLINIGEKNLSEIADITGFSTQSYFSLVFKKHFGMTPSEYKAAHDKNKK